MPRSNKTADGTLFFTAFGALALRMRAVSSVCNAFASPRLIAGFPDPAIFPEPFPAEEAALAEVSEAVTGLNKPGTFNIETILVRSHRFSVDRRRRAGSCRCGGLC